MSDMTYKCVFSDIDGTIANDNLPITYKDQEAVKKLRTQGHYFSFCTGRNIQETKLITPHFEYDYLVLNNGAMIVDQNDQVLYRKQIKNEIAKEILKESYQKYPYLNYTFFDGQQTYGYINQKTSILTEIVFNKRTPGTSIGKQSCQFNSTSSRGICTSNRLCSKSISQI